MKWFGWRKPLIIELTDSRPSYYKEAVVAMITDNKQSEIDQKVEAGIKAALVKQKYKDLRVAKSKEDEAFQASYAPEGPRYKIAESPTGGYIVQERRIAFTNVGNLWRYNGYYLEPSVEQLEGYVPSARIQYIPIKDNKNDRIFSTFDEAEYFLLRTASPDAYETHYDGEPLRRITKTSDRKNGNLNPRNI